MVVSTRVPSSPAALVSSNLLDDLGNRLRGDLITPGHPEHDDARRVVNVTVDRRPLAIVRAADAADVAAAVAFARAYDVPLAVRSGGHSVARLSVIDDALIVDLSHMRQLSIDPEARIARVQAGATSGDLAGPANEYGLALTTGDTHSVGFGGLTSGGGVGFMVRKYGLTIDNLLAAEVVTAAGEIVTASADARPDLFWAVRGGGGNAGIVTEFAFRLAPVSQILGGELILPATREVVRRYLDCVTAAPEDLSTIAHLMHAPPASHVPQELVGKLVFSILVCWSGDLEAGQQAIAPLRALATPLADAVSPMPYPDIYRFTAHQAEPHAAAIRMMFANELSDASLDAALGAMQEASSPFSLVQFRGLGGAFARVPAGATAFASRPALLLRHHRALARPRGRRRSAPGLDRGPVGEGAPRGARRLRQLPGRRRGAAGTGSLPASDLRPAGRDQAALRPDQPLPLQPERSAR